MEEKEKKLSSAQKDIILAALCNMVSEGTNYGKSPQEPAKDLIEAGKIIGEA